jgi:hypothetical protein
VISTSTSVFVLALVVVANVAAAWIIYALVRRTQQLGYRQFTLARHCESNNTSNVLELSKLSDRLLALESQSATSLGAEVAELTELVQALGDTHRRFAGRVSQRLGELAGPKPAEKLDRDQLRSAFLPKVTTP